jgi:hypothetical protein
MDGLMKPRLLALALAALSLTGCQTYRYRIVQPHTGAPAVADQPVVIPYAPLEYRLTRDRDRLAMLITNPTGDQITLLGNRSFAVDPEGESHPIRERVIGPHSYTRMLVPPIPVTYAYPDYWGYGPGWWWGWGWGWGYYGGWYDPFWGAYYGPGYWGPPPLAYRTVLTSYDWKWKTGPARLRLIYERAGKTFEQDFEFIREPNKKK